MKKRITAWVVVNRNGKIQSIFLNDPGENITWIGNEKKYYVVELTGTFTPRKGKR